MTHQHLFLLKRAHTLLWPKIHRKTSTSAGPHEEVRMSELHGLVLCLSKCNSLHVLYSDDPDGRFDLFSIKSKTIRSLWCKLLYPFSPMKDYRVCVSAWQDKGMTKVKTHTYLARSLHKIHTQKLSFVFIGADWNTCTPKGCK